MTLVVVFTWRGCSAWQAAHRAPGIAVTSGYEEESWYAIWRTAEGQPVYFDAAQPPYSAAYFNRLFYAAYSVPARLADRSTRGVQLITWGRILTAAAALLGSIGLGRLLQQINPRGAPTNPVLALLVFMGPLVGWWAHTVRPDVAALALETAGIAIVLLGFRGQPRLTVATAAGMFFAAWAFKQTYVFGLGTSIIFLLARGRWTQATVLVVTMVALWMTTLACLGADYRRALIGGVVHSEFYLALGAQNLRDFLVKSLPLWVLAAAAVTPHRNRTVSGTTPVAEDARLLGMIGLVLTLPLAFAASCKLGAASYYFFTSLVMLALLAASGIALHDRPALRLGAFSVAAVFQVVLLGGWGGRLSLAPAASELAHTWELWRDQPEPRFSHLTAFNLPWLSRASPPLVLAFNYPGDRAAGRAFVAGGVGGMIATGKFRALLLPQETGTHYDGAALTGFVRGETRGEYTVFHTPLSSP